MRKLYGISLVLIGVVNATGAIAQTKIQKIEFLGKKTPNEIVVVGDGPLTFEKVENREDKQLILEIKDAKFANKGVGRKLDTSSFNSKVSLISPYEVPAKGIVRVIVQLRDGADAQAAAVGNTIHLSIDGAIDSAGSSRSADQPTPSDSAAATPTDAAAAPESPNNRIDQFVEAQTTRNFIGRHITLQVKDADIADVFKLIGESSGFNIVMSNDVTGKVNLSLVDVPWDLALDTVLNNSSLKATRTGNVLRVATYQTITQEKQQQLQAKIAEESSQPRVTRIFPVSYAQPKDLIPILSKFGTGSAGVVGGQTSRDTMMVDERTNSIVIQDTAANLDRMGKIIELLDRQTPQVLIESKIVEATESFSKDITGQLGAGRDGGINFQSVAAQNGPLTGTDISNPISIADKGNFAGGTGTLTNTFGAGFIIRPLGRLRLNMLLSINENESKLKVLANPRTVVLNKQPAKIIQGTPVSVPIVVTNPLGGSSIGSQIQTANLSLGVTPTVTNDGNIIMDLNISNDVPQSLGSGQGSGIATKNISTRVVAESGSTLVIGGIYTQSEDSQSSGIPLLRKLPLIGPLFGAESSGTRKNELIIFISPKIVNEATQASAPPSANGG